MGPPIQAATARLAARGAAPGLLDMCMGAHRRLLRRFIRLFALEERRVDEDEVSGRRLRRAGAGSAIRAEISAETSAEISAEISPAASRSRSPRDGRTWRPSGRGPRRPCAPRRGWNRSCPARAHGRSPPARMSCFFKSEKHETVAYWMCGSWQAYTSARISSFPSVT